MRLGFAKSRTVHYQANGEFVKNFEDKDLYPTQAADLIYMLSEMIDGFKKFVAIPTMRLLF